MTPWNPVNQGRATGTCGSTGHLASDPGLIEALVRRAVCCPCAHPPRIAIRYGADTGDRSRAEAVHEALTGSRPDMLVLTLDATAGHGELHCCAVFDATEDPEPHNIQRGPESPPYESRFS